MSAVVEEREEAVVKAVMLFALLCACGGGRKPPFLFDPVPQSGLANVQAVRVDLQALDADDFRIGLGDQTLVPTQIARTTIGSTTIVRASLPDGSLVVARAGMTLTGVIRLGLEGFEIQPTASGHRLIPRSWSTARPLHDPGWKVDVVRERKPKPQAKTSSEPVLITVQFAYTSTVLEARGLDGSNGINSHIAVAIEQLNHASQLGNTGAQFAATAEPVKTVAKEGGRTIDQIYSALMDYKNDEFADARASRKKVQADILVLLVDQKNGGLGIGTIWADAPSALAVTDHNDSLWALTIPHEVGHILGGIHEDDDSDYPYEWGHGFPSVGGPDVVGHTIMRNPCSPSESLPGEPKKKCILLEEWSSPLLHGDKDRYDVARVIRENAETVAGFGGKL